LYLCAVLVLGPTGEIIRTYDEYFCVTKEWDAKEGAAQIGFNALVTSLPNVDFTGI
jgi:hypothetical protein